MTTIIDTFTPIDVFNGTRNLLDRSLAAVASLHTLIQQSGDEDIKQKAAQSLKAYGFKVHHEDKPHEA